MQKTLSAFVFIVVILLQPTFVFGANTSRQSISSAMDAAIVRANTSEFVVVDSSRLMAAAAGDGGGGGGAVTIPEKNVTERLSVGDGITPETTNLLGEAIDLNSGAISFYQTDVSLPGNFDIDVSINRAFRTNSFAWRNSLEMGDWQLAIPAIHTTLIRSAVGVYSGSWGQGYACGGSLNPGPAAGSHGDSFQAWEYWNGDSLELGASSEKLLQVNQTGNAYPRRTKNNWRISCYNIPSLLPANNSMGFLAQSPNGLRYYFDNLRIVKAPGIESGFKSTARFQAFMQVSKIEDRFGNKVVYEYIGNQLSCIKASDGRALQMIYGAGTEASLIKRINAGTVSNLTNSCSSAFTATIGKAWYYEYAPTTFRLVKVTRPDNRFWTFNLNSLASQQPAGCPLVANMRSGSIVHPNGVRGDFEITEVAHYRSAVPALMYGDTLMTQSCHTSLALTKKTLTGPGLSSLIWTYNYSSNLEAQSPSNITTPSGYIATDLKTTTVTAPDGSKTTTIFNRRWGAFEGTVAGEEFRATDGVTLLKRVERQYSNLGNVGSLVLGSTWLLSAKFDFENALPQENRVVKTKESEVTYAASGNNTFTTEFFDYTPFGSVGRQKQYNNIDSTKVKFVKNSFINTIVDTGVAWQLLESPLLTQLSTDNITYSSIGETTYYPACIFGGTSCGSNMQPQYQKRFGNIVKAFDSYQDDGNIKRISFGAISNRWQQFDNYKRGKAQLITMPHRTIAGSTVSASLVVNDDGTVANTTDFNGNKTLYQYDGLSRLTYIDPFDAKWADTSINYADALDGSPQQTITRGNYEKVSKFDALLRPVLVSERDVTSAATTRYTRSTFNAYNKPTFQSFASTSSTETQGRTFTYDGLQRNKSECSTVDGLCTTTEYLANNQIKVTNPRGFATTTSFLAYGAPTQDKPLTITSPESVATTLSYNLFDNLTSISQGGITETRLYDANQFLCKIIRPETNHTLFNNNVLGEVQWSVEGVTGSTTTCETNTTATNKVTNSYDNWGELLSQDYADATPDVLYTRDNQGNVLDVRTGSLSGGAIASPLTRWVYDYNSQNAIETETLNVDGLWFVLNPEYNALGQLQSLQYHNGPTTAFTPNALGQSTQVALYATNVTYHPNGLIKSFNYGNGLSYSQTLDAEQRPYQLTAAGSSVKYQYGYDGNNNVTSMTDFYDTGYSLSGFVYDGLDRLKNVNSKWGAGSFTYDTLSNISTQTIGATSYSYAYNAVNRLSTISGSISKSFGYDNRGNTTQNGSQVLTFNAANELTNGNGASYLYDANHRLVKKVAGGVTTYSVYDPVGTLQMQYNGNTGEYTDFIHLGKQTIAEVKSSSGTITYQHADVLGSPVAESNSGATITARYHYKPFGERMENFATDDTGYTGHQFDTALGATYTQARYLDEEHGRFWSVDPEEFTPQNIQSFNRYAYGNANPYKYVDPDGLVPVNLFTWQSFSTSSTMATAGTMTMPGGDPMMQNANNSAGIAIQNYFEGGWEGFKNVVGMVSDAISTDQTSTPVGETQTANSEQGEVNQSSTSEKRKTENKGDGNKEKGKTQGGSEHTKGARPSTKGKHEAGQARKGRDNRGGEKGDKGRPYSKWGNREKDPK